MSEHIVAFAVDCGRWADFRPGCRTHATAVRASTEQIARFTAAYGERLAQLVVRLRGASQAAGLHRRGAEGEDPMSEQTCTESAPCFACLRCAIRMANLIPEAAHKADAALPSADGGGQWTPDPEKPDHYTFGPLDAERTIALTAASVATIPTGERVELPAGTVLREGGGGIDPAKLLQRIKDLQDDRSKQHAEIERLRAGHASMGGAFLDGFNEGVKAARAEAAGGMAAATIAEALRLVAVAGGTPPELAGLTLAAYNAARSGLKRGTSAKAGVAALMSAYTAGVERAIADHAKART